MALSPKTIRISLALLVSLSFIAAGYYFSSPLRTSIANATSTEEILKAYAAKDTDSDGLPDWQESLYGTDLTNPHSVDPNLTDKEAVDQGKVQPKFKSETPAPEKTNLKDLPGTLPASGSLTDRFAKTFFEKFMMGQQAGRTPSEEEVQSFVAGAISELDLDTKKRDLYKEGNITVSGTGSAALTSYAVAMNTALSAKTVAASKDELLYLNDAILHDDLSALKKITAIANAYKNTAETFKKIPVPVELAGAHLELMNAIMNLGVVLEDMASYKEDPLRTILGLGQYPAASLRLIKTLAAMDDIFHVAGVELSSEDQGYEFYALLEQVRQVSETLPAQ